MGGDNSTTTSSGLNNKALNTAVSTIGTNLNTAMQSGVEPYTQSLYPGMSDTTKGGMHWLQQNATAQQAGLNDASSWAQGVVGSGGYNPALTSAQNVYQGQINAGGYNDALTSAQSGIQQYLTESQADAPGYATLRQSVADDTLGGVNASFLTDGRFGSSVHTDTATESLGNVLAGMDYQNYTDRLGRMLGGNEALAGIGQTAYGNLSGAASGLAGVGQSAMGNAAGAASAIPGLANAALMPSQTMVGIGQAYDADALAARQADADLFDRTQNADWNSLARASGILSGTAGSAGTTTTQSQNVPWWQSVGSGLLGAASLFG